MSLTNLLPAIPQSPFRVRCRLSGLSPTPLVAWQLAGRAFDLLKWLGNYEAYFVTAQRLWKFKMSLNWWMARGEAEPARWRHMSLSKVMRDPARSPCYTNTKSPVGSRFTEVWRIGEHIPLYNRCQWVMYVRLFNFTKMWTNVCPQITLHPCLNRTGHAEMLRLLRFPLTVYHRQAVQTDTWPSSADYLM